MARLLILILTLLGIPAIAAEVEFTAEVESTEVGEGENVAVDFVVATTDMSSKIGEPKFTAPDFEEVNTYQRGTSIQSVYQNGQFSVNRSVRITTVLYPKKTGRLAIRDISVTVEGKAYRAPDVFVEVLPQGSNRLAQRGGRGNVFTNPSQRSAPMPNSGLTPNTARQASILIRTEPDKARVYKGEQIHLRYVLYTRTQIGPIQVERYPTAAGFLKEDLDIPLLRGKLDWERSVINGVEYNRAVLAEYALFPVKEGKLPLDVFAAKISYRGGGSASGMLNNDDVFGLNQFFQAFQMITESRESDRRTIEVLPLPAEGQPEQFSGLVGDFDINAATDKTTLKAGEALNVKVTVEGKGHAGSLERLNIAWPQDFEMYEDRSSTKFSRNGTSQRVFDFLVIPRAKGNFQVPPIEISMFNPETKSYQTRKTEPIPIEVLEGAGGGLAQGSRPRGVSPQSGTTKQDIRHIITAETSGGRAWTKAVNAASQVFAGSSVLALVGLLFGFQRATPRSSDIASRAQKKLRERIRKLDSLTNTDPVKALSEVDASLAEFLERRFGVLKGSLTRVELRDALISKQVEEALVRRVEELTALCENQRFLPPELARNPEQARKAVDELNRIVEALS